MSVLLDEDTTTVVLEGLDFEIPCVEGEHAAELSVSCRFCEDQAFSCRAHWDRKRAVVDAFLSTSVFAVVVCIRCRTQAYSIDDLVLVVPL